MEISGVDIPQNNILAQTLKKEKDTPSSYFNYVRPGLKKLLESFALDKTYIKGEGDYLYYKDQTGHEVKVLDLLGGFGANLLGHNNPDLVQVFQNALKDKKPFLAQASVRSKAGDLAKLLNQHLHRETQKDFILHFGNTGAEATDIAIKHCELFYQNRVSKLKAELREQLQNLFRLPVKTRIQFLLKNAIPLWRFIFRQNHSGLWFLLKNFKRLKKKNLALFVEDLLTAYEKSLLEQNVVFVHLKRSFHGKTLAATALSDNYKKEFSRISLRTLSIGDPISLCRWADRYFVPTLGLDVSAKIPIFRVNKLSRILGIFVEPIQGEGGIYSLTPEWTSVLNNVSRQLQIPLIADEIQCGLGRTGHFLAGTHFGLSPNLVLLSKGLGGSLVKISCVAIEKSYYQKQLGIVQTSTFAEDDLSSIIGIQVLSMLADNNFFLMHEARRKAECLRRQFLELKEVYPRVIRDFRGEGLMLGLEFIPQDKNFSGSLRFLSFYGRLGYVISSYLLNVHHIRMAPCLSQSWVLRIEPSLFIPQEELDSLVTAIKDVCDIFEKGRADLLLQHLVGKGSSQVSILKREALAAPLFRTQLSKSRRYRVAFLAYVSDPNFMYEWDESFKFLSAPEIISLFKKVQNALLEVHGAAEFTVKSITGELVEFQYYGLPVNANYFSRLWKTQSNEAHALIERAIDVAIDHRCKMIALGGFTSIAVANGLALTPRREIAFTTGNSLTAGVAYESIIELCKQQQIALGDTNLGIVGANGNMGRVLSQLFAKKVNFLSLFVRPGKEKGAKENLIQILNRAKADADLFDFGIYRLLKNIPGFQLWFNNKLSSLQWLENFILKSPRSPFKISSELILLKECSVIVTSSNSDEPIIQTQHIGSQKVVICDLAVPFDVSEEVKKLPQVYYYTGGVVELPPDNQLLTIGSGLPLNRVYACLAESLILGLERHRENFSYGHLEISKVQWILDKFHKHGFKIDLKCEKTLGHFEGSKYED
jgi:acetylornithine/succinyldiaminopimelate/putrescine aminotransferase/predicted amino acid dehydrogenase